MIGWRPSSWVWFQFILISATPGIEQDFVYWGMARRKPPWAPPLVELSIGVVGHLLAWEMIEADGAWWAWVSWVQESGGRHVHKVVLAPAAGLRPLEAPEAWRTRGCRGGCWASMASSGKRDDATEANFGERPRTVTGGW